MSEVILTWRPQDPDPVSAQWLVESPLVGRDDEGRFEATILHQHGELYTWMLCELKDGVRKCIDSGMRSSVEEAQRAVERTLRAYLS